MGFIENLAYFIAQASERSANSARRNSNYNRLSDEQKQSISETRNNALNVQKNLLNKKLERGEITENEYYRKLEELERKLNKYD